MSTPAMNNTYFFDLDGTLFEHCGMWFGEYQPIIPNTKETIKKLADDGHKIVITTSRKEIMREQTVEQLILNEVPFDELIMDLPRGKRVIVNDSKPYSGWEEVETACGITIGRNEGICYEKLESFDAM